jgi:hypothetical protein
VRKAVRTAVNSGEVGALVGFQRVWGVFEESGSVGGGFGLVLGLGLLSWNLTVLEGEVVMLVLVRRRLRAGVGREVGMEGAGRFFLALPGMRLVRRERNIVVVVLLVLVCWLLTIDVQTVGFEPLI